MLKTVLLTLVASFGLVACVTDDSTIEAEELGVNPDIIEPDRGNQVDPDGVRENPPDATGQITAPTQGKTHVQVVDQQTADVGTNQGTGVHDTVDPSEAVSDQSLVRGAFDTNHVDGTAVGDACESKSVACRAAAVRRATR
jgi:hypothetical protein